MVKMNVQLVEKEGRGKIFCYRDLLIMEEIEEEEEEEEDERSEYKRRKGRQGHPGYGVTLYFIEGMFGAKKPAGVSIIFMIVDLLAGRVKPEKMFDVSRDIEKILSKNAPIVSFVRMCLNAGTGKTQCYNDARAAGIAIRKQTQLALYEFLKNESKIKIPEITPGAIPPAFGFFESIRGFFRDELGDNDWFGQFEYIESDLSECDANDITSAGEIEAGDFVFEMGELQTATIKYFGHYHKATKKLYARIYPEFDTEGLRRLLL